MPGWDPGRGPPDETIGSDRLISLTRSDEGRRYFSLDGLRSVVNLTDDDGHAVASYHLDAWGNFRFPNELTQSANRFAFTGHIYDQETGLYSAKARYFDPKLGRFLTQDSYLGQIDEPPSLHRYMYANANPLAFVDPTGHTAEGAELQGVLRETKDYLQSQAKGTGVTGFLKGVGFGILSGAVGIVESAVGMIDEGATVAYTVPGVDMTGDPTGQESRQEIKQQYEDLKQTYHVIKEEGFFNAASRIAGNAADTLVAAAKGDPQAIAKVTSFATEMVGPTVALKGSGALGAMRRGARELVEGAGRAVRHGWDEAAGALRRGGDDVVEGAARRTPMPTDPYSSAWARYYAENPGASRFGPGAARVDDPGFSASAGRLNPQPGTKSIEYNVAPHGQQPRPSSPFASHHGIEQGYLKRNVPGYDPNADPTIMLRDTAGGPHRKITGRQASERAVYRRSTGDRHGGDYGTRRAQAIEQMRAQGVPEPKIAHWLLEHEGYMFEIGVPWQW